MHLRFSRLVLLLLLLAASFARAEFRIAFEVTEEVRPFDSEFILVSTAPALPPDTPAVRTYGMEAIIGPTAQRAQREKVVHFTDFAARTAYLIDPGAHTFQRRSLYGDIGFRTAEFDNRFRLRKGLEAAGKRDVRFEPALIEHLFALRGVASVPLTPEVTDDRITFTAEKQRLYSGSTRGEELSEVEAAQFVRWLRYHFPMHPDILDVIQRRRVLPAEFEVFRYETKRVRVHAKATKLERGVTMPDRTTQLAGLKEEMGDIDTLIAPVDMMSAAEFQTRTQALLATAQQHGKDKQYLDCMLGLMEWTLCTGVQPVDDLRRFNRGIMTNDDVKCVRLAVKPQTKETALEMIKALQPIAARTAYPHIVRIFEANNLTVIRSIDEAIVRFKDALRQNPCIVGAWKDLGDLCYLTYNMRDAWRCWDTGRRLNPGYPQFQRVNELEHRLQQEHPEFF